MATLHFRKKMKVTESSAAWSEFKAAEATAREKFRELRLATKAASTSGSQ
jgi:hypothetical protein